MPMYNVQVEPKIDYSAFYRMKIAATQALKQWTVDTMLQLFKAFPKEMDHLFAGENNESRAKRFQLRFKLLVFAFNSNSNQIPEPVYAFLHDLNRGKLSLPPEFLLPFEDSRLRPLLKLVPDRVIPMAKHGSNQSILIQRKIIIMTVFSCFIVVKVIFSEVLNN